MFYVEEKSTIEFESAMKIQLENIGTAKTESAALVTQSHITDSTGDSAANSSRKHTQSVLHTHMDTAQTVFTNY